MSYLHPPIDRSNEHLRLMAIFHYVFAGFAVLGLLFLGLHAWAMQSFLDPSLWEGRQDAPPPGVIVMFRWFYVAFGLAFALAGVLNVMAARGLLARRHWMFCAVVAGLNCMQVPVGTALGVFTLVLLNRPQVRAQFDR